MVLYGSQTSPFVRRIRLLLPENEYQFRKVNIFDRDERESLRLLSPLLKIPILQDGDLIVWDSRIIFNELCRRGYHTPLHIQDENVVTAINDVSDSFIQLLLAQRSEITFLPDSPLGLSHHERIQNTFDFLEHLVESKRFKTWSFPAMCLYALLDWVELRDLAPLKKWTFLKGFRDQNVNQPRVALTNPRHSKPKKE